MKYKKTFLTQIGILALATTSFVAVASGNKERNSMYAVSTTDIADVDAITQDDIEALFNNANFNKLLLPSSTAKLQDGTIGNAVSYTFTEWNQQDNIGTITWTVSLTKGSALAKTISGTISDFITNDQVAINAVTKNDIEALFNNANFNKLLLPSSTAKLQDGTIGNAVSYTFTEWNQQDNIGTITWTVSLTKGRATFDMTGFIRGFKSKFQDIVNAITRDDVEALINDANLDKRQLASRVSKLKPSYIDFEKGIYCIFIVWISDDATGTITWTTSISKYAWKAQISGTIRGFKITDQTAINAVTKNDIEALFNNANFNKLLLPSSTAKLQDGTIGNAVSYTFTEWNQQDNIGTITWTVSLTKGSELAKTISGTIRDFITNDQVAINAVTKNDIEALFNNANFNKLLLPSSTAKLQDGTIGNAVSYTFTEWNQQDNIGTITWTVSLTKGSELAKTISGTIHGFKITDQTAINAVMKNDIEALFNNANFNKLLLPSSTAKLQDGTIGNAVSYTFTEWNQQDNIGTITWTVSLTKGSVLARTISGTISDFKITDQKESGRKVVEIKDESSNGLTKGQIAGITIGSIFGTGIIGFLIYYLVKRKITS